MGMECFWNARQPGQRTWVDRRQLWEAPVEDGGHGVCGSKVMSGGGCQQMAERPLTRFSREGEQVGSQRWPSGFGGESRKVLVGFVELGHSLRSDELLGGDVEAVGVAPNRVMKPGGRVAEFA
jgi:hypothetical protein